MNVDGAAGERGAREARAAAERERSRLARMDASLAHWQNAEAGVPVMAHTMTGAPSYWLVPIEQSEGDTAQSDLAGFVRVTLDGRVAAAGQHRGRLRTVTGITRDEARRMAAESVSPDAVIGDPLFVHDGSPGREGWRVDVTHADGRIHTLLVTHGGVSTPTGGGETD